MSLLALGTARRGGATAEIRVVDGRRVGWFRLATHNTSEDENGDGRGAIGPDEAEAVVRLIHLATEAGLPIIGALACSGTDVREGVGALVAWGGIASALVQASGVVPITMAVIGPCAAGPALLLGLADVVVMTADAYAFVSGPTAVAAMTGETVDLVGLGGAGVHSTLSGIAALVVADEPSALDALAAVLAFFPSNNHEEPPAAFAIDVVDRACEATVPLSANASYDVRAVIDEVADRSSLVELWPGHATNVVTALARIDGFPVGVVANQPSRLAGTLDIAASTKAARFVQLCDAFNVPLLTFVDTPGFQPGKDLEWRGMIRHGAKLVHAYATATVPRVCVILRKAYGGAYIVMDSRGMGSDFAIAWPTAEIAVMGATGAVSVLHGRKELTVGERQALVDDYALRYCTPTIAAERGYVDAVIKPCETRRIVANAFEALRSKREHLPQRRHSNTPL